MSYAATLLGATARRLLLTQALLVLLAAALYLWQEGVAAAGAALFGGAIALLNTLISANRLQRSAEMIDSDARSSLLQLYVGAVIRFLATPALIAAGIIGGLSPVAMLVGFAAAQLAFFISRARPAGSHPSKHPLEHQHRE